MSKVIEDKVQKIREIELQKKSFKKIFRGRNGKLAMTMLESLCYYNTSTYVNGDQTQSLGNFVFDLRFQSP
jgi:hypothetical protein